MSFPYLSSDTLLDAGIFFRVYIFYLDSTLQGILSDILVNSVLSVSYFVINSLTRLKLPFFGLPQVE